jgi:hypothetical protein
LKKGGKAGKNEEAKKTIWNITAFSTVSVSDHTHTITGRLLMTSELEKLGGKQSLPNESTA